MTGHDTYAIVCGRDHLAERLNGGGTLVVQELRPEA